MTRPTPCRHWRGVAVLLALLLLAGCGAPGPILPEQRTVRTETSRPDLYRVVSGDTLYSISFRYGLDWRELARWNDIGPPYTIRVGQRLVLRGSERMRTAVAAAPSEPSRQTPPETRPVTDPPPVAAPRTEPEPDPGPEPDSPPPEGNASGGRPAPTPEVVEPIPAAPGGTRRVEGVVWRWPTAGQVARRYDAASTRKGILIAGEAGQPIRAAADGEVVYSGNGLIGYGELIIVKHSSRMLSAYAHNRERLVTEGTQVQSGQTIARMGRNEGNGAVLHFEIRRDGQPADPTAFLPRR